jgi:hypothetical protein
VNDRTDASAPSLSDVDVALTIRRIRARRLDLALARPVETATGVMHTGASWLSQFPL